MKRLLLALGLLLGLAAPLQPQAPPVSPATERPWPTWYGYAGSPEVIATIADAVTDPMERAYCVIVDRHYPVDRVKAEVIAIDLMVRSKETGRTPNAIGTIVCPAGTKGLVHTHPDEGLRMDCNPSDIDYATLLRNERELGHKYAALVCNGGALRFYWPHEARAQLGVGPQWRQYSPRAEMIYGSALGLSLLGNALLPFGDRDAGGYPDHWTGMDKLAHFGVAYALSSAAMEAHVRPWVAAGLTCGAAGVFEVTQGHISGKDIAWSCAGAALPALWRKVAQ